MRTKIPKLVRVATQNIFLKALIFSFSFFLPEKKPAKAENQNDDFLKSKINRTIVFVCLAFLLLVLPQAGRAATWTVTKVADTADGVCDADCSLREAITAAAAGDTIGFSALFNSAQTITLGGNELVINKNLTIDGTGANLLVISGNNQNRIFNVLPNAIFYLSNVALVRGKAPANFPAGGAILNFGTLILKNANVVSNQASTGGGIANGATMYIINSAVFDNRASDSGGISNGGNNGALTIVNSTISGNTATAGAGGGLNNYNGILDLTNVTVAYNRATGAGGGIMSQSTPVRLRNTLIANNMANAGGADVANAFVSEGYNLVRTMGAGDANGFGANDLIGTPANPINAALAPLGNYGGTTLTHRLGGASAAINAADPQNFPTVDQRGVSRPRAGRADIGAFEYDISVANANASGADSLQNALNNAVDGDVIFFEPGFFNQPRTINLAGATLTISKAVTIEGPGTNLLTISGNNQNRVFGISPGLAQVTIKNLTIANGGNVTEGGGIFTLSPLNLERVVLKNNRGFNAGGAIYNYYQTISLLNTTISNNMASYGGGVFVQNQGSGTPNLTGLINIRQSTFSGNISSLGGGGIFNNGGTTRIVNSTFSGNTAGDGAAIYQIDTRLFRIVNSTVTANNSPNGAAIRADSGIANNSIIAANIGADIFGLSGGANNLIGNGDNSIFVNGVNGNIVGTGANPVNPLLGVLYDNGGATLTHQLLTGSLARAAGSVALAVDPESNQPLTTDQRGMPRFGQNFAPVVDIGSFQAQTPTAASVSVGGRVFDANRRPVANAFVSFTDANGSLRTTRTNPFGYFRFDSVVAGMTYIFEVKRKGFIFAPQAVFVSDDLTDLNFIALGAAQKE
jgi:CSLREA domain-containing protein